MARRDSFASSYSACSQWRSLQSFLRSVMCTTGKVENYRGHRKRGQLCRFAIGHKGYPGQQILYNKFYITLKLAIIITLDRVLLLPGRNPIGTIGTPLNAMLLLAHRIHNIFRGRTKSTLWTTANGQLYGNR